MLRDLSWSRKRTSSQHSLSLEALKFTFKELAQLTNLPVAAKLARCFIRPSEDYRSSFADSWNSGPIDRLPLSLYEKDVSCGRSAAAI